MNDPLKLKSQEERRQTEEEIQLKNITEKFGQKTHHREKRNEKGKHSSASISLPRRFECVKLRKSNRTKYQTEDGNLLSNTEPDIREEKDS